MYHNEVGLEIELEKTAEGSGTKRSSEIMSLTDERWKSLLIDHTFERYIYI